MLHLRLTVPTTTAPEVISHLRDAAGIAHLAHLVGASVTPPGDLVLCEVARETAEAVISDAGAAAEAATPGLGADALVWEELEFRARADAVTSTSFAMFMALAAVIASAGILLDSPILIVGAMVIGPEYGPIAAACIALARWRSRAAGRATTTLAIGLALAAFTSLVATAIFRALALAPESYAIGERQLTAFISRPDGMAAVVAIVAGVAGMLAVTQGRSGSLVGVLVSVTTIPAAANVGVATAYGAWSEVGGAAAQLAINIVGLVAAGVVTLLFQARATRADPSPA
jgi:uncharacterized hydrophobic protein (TIGR00271 family)